MAGSALSGTVTASAAFAGRRSDRAFYAGMALVLAVVMFAGFAPTFFARGLFFAAPPLSAAVRAHGILGTAWIVLFAMQTLLVASGRERVHRRLGAAGALLAIAMLAQGAVVIAGFERGHTGESTRALAVHLFANGAPLALFGAFSIAALVLRHHAAVHKRLMLLAAVVLLPPATGRLFGYLDAAWLASPTYAVAAFANAAYDALTRRRVHPVSLWGGVLLVAVDLATTGMLAALE